MTNPMTSIVAQAVTPGTVLLWIFLGILLFFPSNASLSKDLEA